MRRRRFPRKPIHRWPKFGARLLNGEAYTIRPGVQLVVHPLRACASTKFGSELSPCPFHDPTDHHMVGWPCVWRGDRHLLERICEHGVGHPDPDDRNPDHAHGCDGCCVRP